MADIVISGNTSGSVTLRAPDTAGTTVLTLPTTSGTLIVSGGAQTIEFADGTVSAPSITNSGDTNTGIYFPAADTIAFTEGGVESMRIDSAGDVGIGTTNPSYKLHVVGQGFATTGFATTVDGSAFTPSGLSPIPNYGIGAPGSNFLSVAGFAGIQFYSNQLERMRIDQSGNVGIGTSSPGTKLAINDPGTGLGFINAASGNFNLGLLAGVGGADAYIYQRANANMIFGTNNTERMRIASNGFVGIGESSPNTILHANGDIRSTNASSNFSRFSFGQYGSSGTSYTFIQGDARSSGYMSFYTNVTEAMRIDSSGNLLIGQTSGSAKLSVTGNTRLIGAAGDSALIVTQASGADRDIFLAGVVGVSNGFQVQYISGAMKYTLTGLGTGTVSSSSGVLSASSDQNMKVADGEVESALDKINALKPRYFYWKDTEGNANLEQGRQLGFYAQEVHSVIPEASPEPVKEHDGWGIYDRALVATLTAAIQELNAKVTALEAQLGAK